MRILPTSIKDARSIAAVYQRAFPQSVAFFFSSRDPAALLDLLEPAFILVFLLGGQGVLSKDEQGDVCGYCLYSSEKKRSAYCARQIFSALWTMLKKARLREGAKLLRNSFVMQVSARRGGNRGSAQARIVSIAVNPAKQGQGLGTELLNTALKQLQGQSVALNVRPDNQAALRLYQAAGFKVCGRRKDLLGEWLMLRKDP